MLEQLELSFVEELPLAGKYAPPYEPMLTDKDRNRNKNKNKNKNNKRDKNTHKKSRFRIEELTRSEQDFEIFEMGKRFTEEVTLDEHADFDAVILSCAHVRNDIERKYVNVFICYLDNEAVGFLVGVTTPCFHRSGVVAEQKLWYVKPEHRASYAAIHLVKAYERWARINGATQIFTGSVSTPFTERISRLLEKLKYARVGTLLVKEV